MSADGESAKPPLLILVHGTFGADEACVGERWWQEGGACWQMLRERLEPEIDVPDSQDAEIFHWSGGNGARERHKGGLLLLSRLMELEKEGRPYHLIGHSHGGSVIWTALNMAVERRWTSSKLGPVPNLNQDGYIKVDGDLQEELKLKHLRSWATMGTPFIQVQNSPLATWFGKFLTSLCFVVSTVAMLVLMGMMGNWIFQKVDPEGHQAVVENVEAVGERLADESEDRVEVGNEGVAEALRSVDSVMGIPEQIGATGTAAMIITARWVVFLLLTTLAGLIVFSLFTILESKRVEALMVRRENRAKNQAMLEFGDRWLGLWSTEDEAINTLQASLLLPEQLYGEGREAKRMQLFPRVRIPHQQVFASDGVVRFYRLLFRLLVPLHNRIVAPRGDSVVWFVMARKTQGLDRPGCKVVAVSEAPVHVPSVNIGDNLFLPDEINDRLIEQANQNIRIKGGELLRKIRNALSVYTQGTQAGAPMLTSDEAGMTSTELVHNSYHGEMRVVDLLCEHIISRNSDEAALTALRHRQEAVLRAAKPVDYESKVKADRKWLGWFREEVATKLLVAPEVTGHALPKLGKPNHVATLAALLWPGLTYAILLGSLQPDWMNMALVGGAISTMLGTLLACVALHKANLGAQKEWLARFIVEWSLIIPLAILGGLTIVLFVAVLFTDIELFL